MRITNYNLQFTNYKLQITNYKFLKNGAPAVREKKETQGVCLGYYKQVNARTHQALDAATLYYRSLAVPPDSGTGRKHLSKHNEAVNAKIKKSLKKADITIRFASSVHTRAPQVRTNFPICNL